MAEPGKLRWRDDRLIVEGMGGQILAEVEPDDDMRIDTSAFTIARFMAGPRLEPIQGRIVVSWYQTVDGDRGFVDADAVEIDDQRPALDPGDG